MRVFISRTPGTTDEIPISEVTITLFGLGYPRKLIKHLREVRGYQVEKQEDGIYYVRGDFIPIKLWSEVNYHQKKIFGCVV